MATKKQGAEKFERTAVVKLKEKFKTLKYTEFNKIAIFTHKILD